MKLLKKWAFSLICFGCVSQINAQSALKGQSIVDLYYGFPNFYTAILKSTVTGSGQTGIKIGSLGPLGGRFEYLVANKIGVGLDVRYATTSISYIEQGIDNNGNAQNYNYKVAVNRLAVLARFNYHFGSTPQFDPYATVGAGYSNFSAKWTTNDPYFDEVNGGVSSPVPVAFRLGVGARYFFVPNVGLNMEIALGGPLITGGLSFRFGGGAAE